VLALLLFPIIYRVVETNNDGMIDAIWGQNLHMILKAVVVDGVRHIRTCTNAQSDDG
jgi:hypothetical protein